MLNVYEGFTTFAVTSFSRISIEFKSTSTEDKIKIGVTVRLNVGRYSFSNR